MFRAIIRKLILISLSLYLIGCSKSGYMIKFEAEKIDPAVINQLEEIIKARGFSTSTDERITHEGDFISTYWKNLSDAKYNFIYIRFFYTKIHSHNSWLNLRIYIENRVKGLEPSIKTQIDELGDIFYEELIKSAGKDKVIIERKEMGPPLFY